LVLTNDLDSEVAIEEEEEAAGAMTDVDGLVCTVDTRGTVEKPT
jgi:hypothetical protein